MRTNIFRDTEISIFVVFLRKYIWILPGPSITIIVCREARRGRYESRSPAFFKTLTFQPLVILCSTWSCIYHYRQIGLVNNNKLRSTYDNKSCEAEQTVLHTLNQVFWISCMNFYLKKSKLNKTPKMSPHPTETSPCRPLCVCFLPLEKYGTAN